MKACFGRHKEVAEVLVESEEVQEALAVLMGDDLAEVKEVLVEAVNQSVHSSLLVHGSPPRNDRDVPAVSGQCRKGSDPPASASAALAFASHVSACVRYPVSTSL